MISSEVFIDLFPSLDLLGEGGKGGVRSKELGLL